MAEEQENICHPQIRNSVIEYIVGFWHPFHEGRQQYSRETVVVLFIPLELQSKLQVAQNWIGREKVVQRQTFCLQFKNYMYRGRY